MNIRNVVLFDIVWCSITKDDEGFYYCEAITFDYLSYGKTEQEAIDHFKRGFAITILQHIDRFGDLCKLQKEPLQSIMQNHLIRVCQKHLDEKGELYVKQ